MNNEKIVIGIDTSNYTTSIAALSLDGKLLSNIKLPLEVRPGQRGLRQSDALFSHTVNIPILMRKLKQTLPPFTPVCVGVSEKPRNAEGSYMPCFLAGVSAAESISAAASVPIYQFSHQCGHIMAAIYSSERYDLLDRPFAAFHISGGTTELVRVTADEYEFKTELLGGTCDLNAGQVIDRIGVLMGLDFPAGAALEKLALQNEKKIPHNKISCSEMKANLSGLENLASGLYKKTNDKALVSAFVLDFIGRNIIAISEQYEERFGKTTFVYAGGVMCNSILRKMISERFDSVFADVSVSSDNAVGIAELARRANERKDQNGH